MSDIGNQWADRAAAANRGGQQSWARVCEGRARSAWAREESERQRELAEDDDDKEKSDD